MRNSNAIIINTSSVGFDRNNPNDPLTALPWDDIDSIYTAMLGDTLRVLSRVGNVDVLIYRNEKEISDDFFLPYHQFTRVFNLTEDPLGEQLRQAVEDAFTQNYQRVMVMLENNPTLSSGYLRNVLNQLEYDDDCIVLGTTYENRFHLVAMKSNHGKIFETVDGDPLKNHEIMLKNICSRDVVLFILNPIHSIFFGKNIINMRKTLELSDSSSIDFPSKTSSIFKLLEKKYRYQKILS